MIRINQNDLNTPNYDFNIISSSNPQLSIEFSFVAARDRQLTLTEINNIARLTEYIKKNLIQYITFINSNYDQMLCAELRKSILASNPRICFIENVPQPVFQPPGTNQISVTPLNSHFNDINHRGNGEQKKSNEYDQLLTELGIKFLEDFESKKSLMEINEIASLYPHRLVDSGERIPLGWGLSKNNYHMSPSSSNKTIIFSSSFNTDEKLNQLIDCYQLTSEQNKPDHIMVRITTLYPYLHKLIINFISTHLNNCQTITILGHYETFYQLVENLDHQTLEKFATSFQKLQLRFYLPDTNNEKFSKTFASLSFLSKKLPNTYKIYINNTESNCILEKKADPIKTNQSNKDQRKKRKRERYKYNIELTSFSTKGIQLNPTATTTITHTIGNGDHKSQDVSLSEAQILASHGNSDFASQEYEQLFIALGIKFFEYFNLRQELMTTHEIASLYPRRLVPSEEEIPIGWDLDRNNYFTLPSSSNKTIIFSSSLNTNGKLNELVNCYQLMSEQNKPDHIMVKIFHTSPAADRSIIDFISTHLNNCKTITILGYYSTFYQLLKKSLDEETLKKFVTSVQKLQSLRFYLLDAKNEKSAVTLASLKSLRKELPDTCKIYINNIDTDRMLGRKTDAKKNIASLSRNPMTKNQHNKNQRIERSKRPHEELSNTSSPADKRIQLDPNSTPIFIPTIENGRNSDHKSEDVSIATADSEIKTSISSFSTFTLFGQSPQPLTLLESETKVVPIKKEIEAALHPIKDEELLKVVKILRAERRTLRSKEEDDENCAVLMADIINFFKTGVMPTKPSATGAFSNQIESVDIRDNIRIKTEPREEKNASNEHFAFSQQMVVSSSAIRSKKGPHSQLPPTLIYPQSPNGTIQVDKPTYDIEGKQVNRIAVHYKEIIEHLKLQAANKAKELGIAAAVVYGEIFFTRMGPHIDDPTHSIPFYATQDRVILIEAQDYDSRTDQGNPLIEGDKLTSRYEFYNGQTEITADILSHLCHYLIYGYGCAKSPDNMLCQDLLLPTYPSSAPH